MDRRQSLRPRRTSVLLAALAGALFLGGCAPEVLVKDFRLENAAIGISKGKPLNVQVGTTMLEPTPSKQEAAACIKRANAFVTEITGPLVRALSAGLQQSHVKVVSHVSTYHMVMFMRDMRPNVKSDAGTKAFLKALKAQEEASGKAGEQPDMMLDVFFGQIVASPGTQGRKDHYMIFIQASIVTVKGPGAGMGPVWKTVLRVDAQPDRVNNDAVVDQIASQILDRMKASKVIPS